MKRSVAFVLIAVLAAGCSKSPAHTDTVSTSANATGSTVVDTRSQADKFAACMRDNGVRQFPDPDASGQITIDAVANEARIDTTTATFRQAMDACKDLQPPGFTGHKRNAAQQAAALRWARCMRDNGAPEIVDPGPDDPLLNIDGSKPGLVARVHAAGQKCRDFATAAGVTGGR